MNALKTHKETKCKRCLDNLKKEFEKQVTDKTLEMEYNLFTEFRQTAGENIREYDFTLFFSALVSEGMDEEFCKRIFEKVVMYSSTSEMFGKKLTSEEFKENLKKMDIDLNRVEYHQEDIESFKKRYWDTFPNEPEEE